MHTITNVYDSYSSARRAVTELELAGIPMADISVLANQQASLDDDFDDDDDIVDDEPGQDTEAAPGAGVGAVVGGAAGLLAGLGLLAIPGLGPVVAAGWLASTALGVVAGGATGGIVGSLIDAGVPEDDAHTYSEAVRRGGTLVSVRTHPHNIASVKSILDKFTPLDPVQQGANFRKDGWNRFDAHGGAYESAKSINERDRRTM